MRGTTTGDQAIFVTGKVLEALGDLPDQRLLADVELCAPPDTSHPVFSRLAASLPVALETQGQGNLGTRMDHALTRQIE